MVAGLGRAGNAAARALIRRVGPEAVSVWDGSTRPALREARDELTTIGVRVELDGEGTSLLETQPAPRCLVKSPGIGFDLPLIEAAADRGMTVIDELELGWRLCPAPLVAVTGTNGKSTVCALIQSALVGSGIPAPLAGNTLFGPPLSATDVEAGAPVVCEVSSYQLEGCPAFLPDVAVFTNLSCDHLERHRTVADCGACKARMFVRGDRCTPLAVINVGDEFGRGLAEDVAARGGRSVSFGDAADADYRLRAAEWDVDSGTLQLDTPAGPLNLRTRLPGSHNAANVAASLATCDALGLDPAQTATAMAAAPGIPGRFERVDAGQPFEVIVDFAHTPDGIAHCLGSARAILERGSSGSMRVVLGALSVLVPAQRAQMGREAGRRADQLILTTDRRGATQPADVPGDLIEGAASAGAEPEVIADRRDALERALQTAQPGDMVLILGRGERAGPLFDPFGRQSSFDDRQVARELLGVLVSEPA